MSSAMRAPSSSTTPIRWNWRAFLEEKDVDLFIGGVKERPIAYKLGVGFCDHNHERKEALAGFEGMLNFAREVYCLGHEPGLAVHAAQ